MRIPLGGSSIRMLALLALVAMATAAACLPASAARRAFVVGNSRYAHAPPLDNATNDARDLAARLGSLGYRVTLALDATRSSFLASFQAFVRTLAPDDVALLYYAGHGLQIGGENYLFPVDDSVESEAEARTRLVSLNALLADMTRATRTRIVILDACRNNPFADSLGQSAATRGLGGPTRGLARVYAGVGSFIAYSTQPGNVALDGTGRNSPFAAALVRHLAEPGADVHKVMRLVRADVQRETAEQQIPWENSSLVDEVAFGADPPSPAPAARVEPAPPSPPRTPPPPAPGLTSSNSETYSYVTGLDPNGDNFLALRSSPAGDGVRIATMGPDTLLKVVASRGPWRQVVLLDGARGWAHGDWIACCRRLAFAPSPARPAPRAPSPSPSPSPGESCDSLWHARNAVWHRHSYCFTTDRGRREFGNAGCSHDRAAARAAMSPTEIALIEALAAREQALGCH